MTHAEIVRTYSDNALDAIIRELARTGLWKDRLTAAIQEKQQRTLHQQQQDQESTT